MGSSPTEGTMRYYIAYKDSFERDFHGTPWIYPEGGFDSLIETKNAKHIIEFQHCTNLTIFGCKRIPETVTWSYVDEHKIID